MILFRPTSHEKPYTARTKVHSGMHTFVELQRLPLLAAVGLVVPDCLNDYAEVRALCARLRFASRLCAA